MECIKLLVLFVLFMATFLFVLYLEFCLLELNFFLLNREEKDILKKLNFSLPLLFRDHWHSYHFGPRLVFIWPKPKCPLRSTSLCDGPRKKQWLIVSYRPVQADGLDFSSVNHSPFYYLVKIFKELFRVSSIPCWRRYIICRNYRI